MKDCPNPACDRDAGHLAMHDAPKGPEQTCVLCVRCGMHGPYDAEAARAIALWDALPRVEARDVMRRLSELEAQGKQTINQWDVIVNGIQDIAQKLKGPDR